MRRFGIFVSIQPKPKKGLKDLAEKIYLLLHLVSIQPKPKKGLKEKIILVDVLLQ